MDTLQTREHTFQAKAAAEFSKLRSLQAELEAETGQACFLGLSAADTLRQCVRLGNHRAAAKIRQELKITDKRFWWIKVRAWVFRLDPDTLEVGSHRVAFITSSDEFREKGVVYNILISHTC